MTREEAKKIFSDLLLFGKAPCKKEELEDLCKVVLTALEQEPTTKKDLGVDWENYKDADGNCLDDLILEVLQNNFDCGNTYGYKVADEIIGLLPSVTPQEPKTGHWIADVDKWGDVVTTVNGYRCDKCNAFNSDKDNYCPHCGAKMAETEADNGDD